MAFEKSVKKWIVDGFQPYKLETIDIELSGSSDVGDGYVGGIFFAKVSGQTKDGRNKKFNVALKYGKDSVQMREVFPVTEVFKNEIFVYATLVPIFRKMEKANNFNEVDSFMVKCFNTLLYDNQEVLLLENLKSLGYVLYDRLKPLNIDHLNLTLEKYGKFHALGLAYREKNPEDFNKMRITLQSRMKASMPLFTEVFDITQDTLYAVLEAKGELKLLDCLREEAPEGLTSKFDELSQIDEPNSTIIHGDCWNNNFMFKYDERNKSKPSAVKFLDFQLIQAAPLVYDLSYHIYATASETELKEFQALLRVYHNSLSTCLNQLGFSSDKLFPMSELEKQWKKYSIFGVVMASMAMPFALADKTDAVDFASNDEHNQLKNMFEQIKKKKFNLFAPRIVAALRHHYGFSDGDYIVAA